MVDLVNALCDQYDITIFTIYAKGELEKQLSKTVKLKSLYGVSYSELSNFQKHFSVPLKLLLLKKYIYNKKIKKDYDLEIAFLEGPITRLFSSKNKNTRKLAWVHNDISVVFGDGIKSKLKKEIDKKIYEKYETLIFVSQDNMKKFKSIYNEKKIKSINKIVIYNYIDKNSIIKKAQQKMLENFDGNTTNFVTVARLVKQKGIDRLIDIHNKLIKEGIDNNIYVIGDGPEKTKLEKKIREKNLENTFFLLGKKENPYPYIKHADYFCLLSYFEGYGMVLEEAKILNKPIIITDTAAREAINGYKNSTVLGNSKEEIYEGLKKIILKNRVNLDNNQEDDKSSYDNSSILKEVMDLIEK